MWSSVSSVNPPIHLPSVITSYSIHYTKLYDVYPPLLSIIMAALLIFAGAMLISIARFERRQQRHFNNPTIEFFIRH